MTNTQQAAAANSSDKRLGRSVTRIHQGAAAIPAEHRAALDELLLAGTAMDFVARIHGAWGLLPAEAVFRFAQQAGIGRRSLVTTVLPALKKADVADFTMRGEELAGVQEFLGVTGSLVEQSYRVLLALSPSPVQMAVLHSVEVAAFAPLTLAQHLDQLALRGFTAQEAEDGQRLALAARINHRIWSSDLNEYVLFNPYVWEAGQVDIARFLRNLPSSEREVLLGVCERAIATPGLTLTSLDSANRGVFSAAQKVGLVHSATVKSSAAAGSQTYVFSPSLDTQDDRLVTTESLHQRKLFVAHMLFGHERADARRGRIDNPAVLARALLNRGSVGPATSISTDYHLLETHGIVAVREGQSGRSFLELVKPEIVEGGLAWLESSADQLGASDPQVNLLRSPGQFVSPEVERAHNDLDDVNQEIALAAVLELRREVRHATRQDRPTNLR